MLATSTPTHYPPIGHQCWPPALPSTTLLLVTMPLALPPTTLLLVTNAGHRCSHPLPSCWSPMLATGASTHYPPVGHQCWPLALPPTTLLLVTNAGHWHFHLPPFYWSSASHIGLTANKLPAFPFQASSLVKGALAYLPLSCTHIISFHSLYTHHLLLCPEKQYKQCKPTECRRRVEKSKKWALFGIYMYIGSGWSSIVEQQ